MAKRINVYIYIYQEPQTNPERYLFKKKVPFWPKNNNSCTGTTFLVLVQLLHLGVGMGLLPLFHSYSSAAFTNLWVRRPVLGHFTGGKLIVFLSSRFNADWFEPPGCVARVTSAVVCWKQFVLAIKLIFYLFGRIVSQQSLWVRLFWNKVWFW